MYMTLCDAIINESDMFSLAPEFQGSRQMIEHGVAKTRIGFFSHKLKGV